MNKVEIYGLTKKQIKELYGDTLCNDFLKWIQGQTVAIINKQEVYYYNDIRRYLEI